MANIKNIEDFLVEIQMHITESIDGYNGSTLNKENEVKARIKVNRALVWLNINRGFFGRLLGDLNIYGSSLLDPKTMCTNGLNITYHPEFVLSQSDKAIRFVLAHELLHCVGDHMTRRGSRDPLLWNYAADYAINPILSDEANTGDGMEWPKNEDGTRMGLFEEKYSGMRAEDVYDILIKENKGSEAKSWEQGGGDFGKVIDCESTLPAPDSEDSVVQDITGGEPGDPSEKGSPISGERQGEGEGEGGESNGSNLIGKKVTITSGPNKGETGIIRKVFPNGDIEI